MISNICQTIAISFIVIFLIHYLFNYLQATFTTPKVKDMINRPNEKYESIMKVVNTQEPLSSSNLDSNLNTNLNSNLNESSDMKNELNQYINEINTDSDNNVINSQETAINSALNPYSTNESDTTPISELNTNQ